jgi:hypothetical protein
MLDLTPRPHAPDLVARIHETDAERGLRASLRNVAEDLLHAGAHDHLLPEDRERMRRLLSGPVEAAARAALEVLVEDLGQTLEDADPAFMRRIDHVRRRAALGRE